MRAGMLVWGVLALALAGAGSNPTQAQAAAGAERRREFRPGTFAGPEELPRGRFRSRLESMAPAARQRAVAWLRGLHFPEADVDSLHADEEGGIYYADTFVLGPGVEAVPTEPVVAEAALPVSPFPSALVFHSRPGAPNVLYLNFGGEDVTGTAWNNSLGRTVIPAVAFSTDSDYATFSDSEQVAIRRIWQRVSEDYSMFDIDVTTERPAVLGTRVAMALITRNKDADGLDNPSSSAGGVAYMGVFGTSSYATYRPAWIYHNNLANDESYTAEAVSHEVGHNMGLSHDGTSSADYYGGHGTGEVSWGPIMGTGYNRNVSHWSKGEYYQANNTQDDLSVLAAKLSYRADDHGNGDAAATALVITGGTTIQSTTPESDPTNAEPANKGVLERGTDVDVFSFVTGSGGVSLVVNPWISPSGRTRGGDLDVYLELYDAAGRLVTTSNGVTTTVGRIDAMLSEGLYYLHVRGTGVYDPEVSPPLGYTAYSSLGQYFVSGTVVPSSLVVPPRAELAAGDVVAYGAGAHLITVTYADDVGVDVSTLDDADVRVTGPGGYDREARLVSVDNPLNGTPRIATYAVEPPDAVAWTAADNGSYRVAIEAGAVADVGGVAVPAAELGGFTVLVPRAFYAANMDLDPGWSMEGDWEHGVPAYASGGPTSGHTGTAILGYNLAGNYGKNLALTWATTPAIPCSGGKGLTLNYWRWLRTRTGDTAVVQVSTNQVDWVEVWSSTSTRDSAWREVQHVLPSWVEGSPTLWLRWGLSSGPNLEDIGWNLDDIVLLGDAPADVLPPTAVLNAATLTAVGSPEYLFAVTYTDDTAVRVDTLGAADLLVTGPNGYSNLVDYVGVDTAPDGSPRVASYSIPAPGGTWDATDNGTYAVLLLEGEVSDASNNAMPETALGTFAVNIAQQPQLVELTVEALPSGWGQVSPDGGSYEREATVSLTALPAPYYRFDHWEGDAGGTNNPLVLVMASDRGVRAVFGEVLTASYPTPYWWLAANGFTNDFEQVVTEVGANGMPVWQSYVAGLDPNDPASQLRVTALPEAGTGEVLLTWPTVEGRTYTILSADLVAGPYVAMPGAEQLPATVQSLIYAPGDGPAQRFYRVEVRLP